ncbi:MAG: HNH endonuclease [Clostridia bacterium]|nr:HNH endonuclease [Clostridia bacterium]
MHKRTKALAISKAVKEKVYERDCGLCVLCGSLGLPEVHYISRSRGGVGIEQNIVTLCCPCHNQMDSTTVRENLLRRVKEYLDLWYPNFTDAEQVYKKE